LNGASTTVGRLPRELEEKHEPLYVKPKIRERERDRAGKQSQRKPAKAGVVDNWKRPKL